MKLDKLVKTLRRDLAANPMKAGVLGVLLLGGLYFWGPLVWKCVGKKGAVAAPNAAVVPTPLQEPAGGQSVGVQPAGGTKEKKEEGLAWREIRDRREKDPLARSADFRPQWSQIFQGTDAVATAAKPQAEVHAKKAVEVDPRNLGLVLQGIAIGPNAKKAIISGKVYREFDSITVSQKTDATNNTEDQQPDLKYRLVRVFRKMVEVERGGKTWQLKLASTELEKQQPLQTRDEPADEKAGTPDKKKASPLKE